MLHDQQVGQRMEMKTVAACKHFVVSTRDVGQVEKVACVICILLCCHVMPCCLLHDAVLCHVKCYVMVCFCYAVLQYATLCSADDKHFYTIY